MATMTGENVDHWLLVHIYNDRSSDRCSDMHA